MQQDQPSVFEPVVRELHESAVILVPDVLAQSNGHHAGETVRFPGRLPIILLFGLDDPKA